MGNHPGGGSSAPGWYCLEIGASWHTARYMGKVFAAWADVLAAVGPWCERRGNAVLVYGRPEGVQRGA